jgi:two-component system alkaline phosphatase synthesis response regulator PhoP
MRTVLIVEDDAAMRRGLADNFQLKGYYVLTAYDGREGLDKAIDEKPDLIVLDIMLPEINGYEVCSLIRETGLDMPIIMLTAKSDESDVVLGLNVGADDYVIKPFSIKELLARAEAFLRRRTGPEQAVYEFADWRLDVATRSLERGGRPIPLSPGEFRMLHLFIQRSGCPLTREEIRAAVWGHSRFVSARDVDRTIRSLRGKIEPNPDHPAYIQTMEAIGYRFDMPKPEVWEGLAASGNGTDR